MVDFNKLLEEMKSPEYQQRKKEREEQEKLEEELRQHSICVTAHRLNKLGGYNMKNPTMLRLKERLLEVFENLIIRENIYRLFTGGALGGDTASFWCFHILKEKYPHIKNIIAVPFKNQDGVWTEEQKKWYKKMLSLADKIYYVDEIKEYKTGENIPIGDYSPAKMQKRNEFMSDKTIITISIWDGSKGGTANCTNYSRRMGKRIIRLDPRYNFELIYM
jgi:uncharacterized phage-like protein YoqJ